jgi:hypothetical protein
MMPALLLSLGRCRSGRPRDGCDSSACRARLSRLRYRRPMSSTVPAIDAGAKQRLAARFGSQAEAWFVELPGVLAALAGRWQLEIGSAIPRGSVSAVYRCRMADGRPAVLKASPDRARLALEAAALRAWHTAHTPAVFLLDAQLGRWYSRRSSLELPGGECAVGVARTIGTSAAP